MTKSEHAVPDTALHRAIRAYAETNGYTTDPAEPRPLPDWIIAHLGHWPHWPHSSRWFALAQQTAAWREQHAVTGVDTLLGERPADVAGAAAWQALHDQVDKYHADVVAAEAPKPLSHWALRLVGSIATLLAVHVGFTTTALAEQLRSAPRHTLADVVAEPAWIALTFTPVAAAILFAIGAPVIYGRVLTERMPTALPARAVTVLDTAVRGVAIAAQAAMACTFALLVVVLAVGVL